jgi:hypothetical protein
VELRDPRHHKSAAITPRKLTAFSQNGAANPMAAMISLAGAGATVERHKLVAEIAFDGWELFDGRSQVLLVVVSAFAPNVLPCPARAMTGLPRPDDMAMSPDSSAAGAIPTRPRPIATHPTIGDLITNYIFMLHPLRVDRDDLSQSIGQDHLPSLMTVSLRTAELLYRGARMTSP